MDGDFATAVQACGAAQAVECGPALAEVFPNGPGVSLVDEIERRVAACETAAVRLAGTWRLASAADELQVCAQTDEAARWAVDRVTGRRFVVQVCNDCGPRARELVVFAGGTRLREGAVALVDAAAAVLRESFALEAPEAGCVERP